MFNKPEDRHPSYGLVVFSRVSVGGGGRFRMFGSSIEKHPTVISLKIKRAYEVFDLSENNQFEDNELVEVWLTEAQFSALLTTMNVGRGVPCTIKHIDQNIIDAPPARELEIEKVKKDFQEQVKGLADKFKNMTERAQEILGTAKSTKEERRQVLNMFVKAKTDLESNYQFIIDQFAEATQRIVTEAKAEVDAFVTQVIHNTGLEKLRELTSGSPDGGVISLPKQE